MCVDFSDSVIISEIKKSVMPFFNVREKMHSVIKIFMSSFSWIES
jgi:hypothetical protein